MFETQIREGGGAGPGGQEGGAEGRPHREVKPGPRNGGDRGPQALRVVPRRHAAHVQDCGAGAGFGVRAWGGEKTGDRWEGLGCPGTQ